MTTQSPFRLDGKIAAVIGASSGIGEAVAVACARAGAHVSCLGGGFAQVTCLVGWYRFEQQATQDQ